MSKDSTTKSTGPARPWRRRGHKTTLIVKAFLSDAGRHVPKGGSLVFIAIVLLVLTLLILDASARKNTLSKVSAPVLKAISHLGSTQSKTLPESSFGIMPKITDPRVKALTEKVPAIEPWSYFHPQWQQHALDTNPSSAAPIHYQELYVSAEKLRRIVHDPDGRLEKEFQVPFQLADRVYFWLNVYTKLNKHARLVHDRDNPSIIYGTIDYSPLYANITDKMRAELNRRQIEKKILADLKARIEEAAGLTKTEILTPWEKAELRNFLSRAGAMNADRVARLLSRIRTQSGQRNEFLEALNRSEKLLPYIEAVMKSYSLPTALARLPFVESSFNPRASSKVGAVGIWQFMPETAAQMIHPSDRKIWAEPLTQSKAAARLLIIFRSLLPDWSTAITSYNSGVGRLQRLVRKYHARDIVKIIESNDKTLGFAGKNFYAQFLTANLIEAYKEELFAELSDDEQAIRVAFRPVKTFNERFREVY